MLFFLHVQAGTCFLVMCKFNVAVMRIIFYTNGTITALSNDNEIITCDNGVWQMLTQYIRKIKAM